MSCPAGWHDPGTAHLQHPSHHADAVPLATGGCGIVVAEWRHQRGECDRGVRLSRTEMLSRESTFNRYATSKAGAQAVIGNVQFPRPVCNGLRLALIGHVVVTARIVRLLYLCSPSTIIGRVRAVIVDSFDGVLRGWTRPHVFEKSSEVIAPAVADGDPTCSIELVGSLTGIGAAGDDSAPVTILWAMRQAMSRIAFRGDLGRKATTTLGRSARYSPKFGSDGITTLTLPNPFSTATDRTAMIGNRGQAKQLLATVVNDSLVGKWGRVNCYHTASITPEVATCQMGE